MLYTLKANLIVGTGLSDGPQNMKQTDSRGAIWLKILASKPYGLYKK